MGNLQILLNQQTYEKREILHATAYKKVLRVSLGTSIANRIAAMGAWSYAII